MFAFASDCLTLGSQKNLLKGFDHLPRKVSALLVRFALDCVMQLSRKRNRLSRHRLNHVGVLVTDCQTVNSKKYYFFDECFQVVFVLRNSRAAGYFFANSSRTVLVKSPWYFSSAIACICSASASGNGMVFRMRFAALPVVFFFMAYTVIHCLTLCNRHYTPQDALRGKVFYLSHIQHTRDC